ncbi:MAG TPA: alpha-1,4-glucan--maltose-1-phosphate maltosyltransferase [Steroidobacteraceae bacterium]|nr:alpha-1,4-glucan--maltose-1-phosphate maltosyltransferase [Steroidobacteraceae bacterium]
MNPASASDLAHPDLAQQGASMEATAPPAEGRVRAVIENVTPCVDAGRFAAKRTLGDELVVQADVFADGHDALCALLLYRHESEVHWQRAVMHALGNDRWQGSFVVSRLGLWHYRIEGWVDALETWRADLLKKQAAGQDLHIDLQRGVQLAQAAAARAKANQAAEDSALLQRWAQSLEEAAPAEERLQRAQDAALHALARTHPAPEALTRSPMLTLLVERERARYSTWYEMFPRSAAATPQAHGSLADCERLLPYVAQMGFDVLYLPPIHPIGRSERRGPNNRPVASQSDPGSPWAIGASDGGHKSIHPELGTLEEFRHLVARAGELGIELALDVAFQCSPDHPYVREHPEWFLKRPDGSIQYAENPPKKYQDIYPFDFGCRAWRELWLELASIFEFWVDQGVRIFRVDNPHTKPFALWEWLIERVRRRCPEAIFLAEAFTRPKVMYRLAKLGFSQSYTYFAWRNASQELREYFEELRRAPVSDFFRPNLWPNTPDILTEQLQFGGRAAFMARLVLAATLGASYGIYGPPFELMEHQARDPGSEEYLDSEKYQVRFWDRDRPDSLRDFIALINRVRRENVALQSDATLRFHAIDNPALIAYSKRSADGSDRILVIVNLDPHHAQSGWVSLDSALASDDAADAFQAHDLLSGARFLWKGERNYVGLDPATGPAHILRIRRRIRSERDFDYYL